MLAAFGPASGATHTEDDETMKLAILGNSHTAPFARAALDASLISGSMSPFASIRRTMEDFALRQDSWCRKLMSCAKA